MNSKINTEKRKEKKVSQKRLKLSKMNNKHLLTIINNKTTNRIIKMAIMSKLKIYRTIINRLGLKNNFE